MGSALNITHSAIHLFEQTVARHPDKPALQDGERSVTYIQLDQWANGIGHKLQSTDTGAVVGTLLEHSIENVATILGILKSGKVYLPINPRNSKQTLQRILNRSQLRALITHSVDDFDSDHNPHLIEPISSSESRQDGPLIETEPQDLCCILYTSGSSGEPKGVMHSHRNVVHTAQVYTEHWNIVKQDKILSLSHSSFSASMANLFSCLLNGCTSYIFDPAQENFEELPEIIRTNELTIYHSVPSVFLNLVQLRSAEDGFPSIREISLGGEVVTQQHIKLLKERFSPTSNLHIVYGAAEALGAVFSVNAKDRSYTGTRFALGTTVKDFEVSIVDSDRQILPTGQEGEIRVTSEFTALGYHNDTERTQKSFETSEQGRSYYTGDIGYLDEDGYLLYVGRKDAVIKISGQKVSLTEVEAHLISIPGIREAAVVPHPHNDQSIMAYVVQDRRLADADIRQRLSDRLPHYMIPAHFHALSSLPKNAHGKVDRRSLSEELKTPAANVVPAQSEIEQTLIAIWIKLLGKDSIGISDNFFDLGGDSLKAMRLVSIVKEELGIRLRLRDIFEVPTIHGLADRLEHPSNR